PTSSTERRCFTPQSLTRNSAGNRRSCSGELTGAINRDVGDASDRPRIIGQDQGIDVDEEMPLMLVVADDPRAYAERVADPRGGKILDLAADMHPGAEGD